jgi:hypothetical protein
MNIYLPNDATNTFMKQKLQEMQGDVDRSTQILGHFNTPLSTRQIGQTEKVKTQKSKATKSYRRSYVFIKLYIL